MAEAMITVRVTETEPFRVALDALKKIADNWAECRNMERMSYMDYYNGFEMCETARAALKEIGIDPDKTEEASP